MQVGSYARLQAANQKGHARAALIKPVFQNAGEDLLVHGYGNEDIRTAHGAKIMKIRWSNADDVIVLRTNTDRLSQYLWITAELGLP